VIGRREGSHVRGDRICPLLEQHCQIFVMHLPQRAPHQMNPRRSGRMPPNRPAAPARRLDRPDPGLVTDDRLRREIREQDHPGVETLHVIELQVDPPSPWSPPSITRSATGSMTPSSVACVVAISLPSGTP
jgi:hypothetical protein